MPVCRFWGEREVSTGPHRSERHAAFTAFYDRHAAGVYAFVLGMLRNGAEAEDVVQVVFLKVFEKQQRWFGLRNPVGYLYRSARNEAISRLRKQQVRERSVTDIPALLQPKAGVPFDETERLNAALHALPDEQREVVMLKNFEDLTFREIAKAVGCSLGTAASRYRYALEKLRDLLEDDFHGSH